MSLKVLKFFLFKKWGSSKGEFKNVVVYTVGIVGDNVVMLPALAALRRRYKQAKITVITNCQIWDRQGAIGVLEPSVYKDSLIVLNEDPVQRRGLRLWVDGTKFEETQCDLFVNLSPFGNRGRIGAVVREMIFAKKLGAKHAIGFRMSTYSRKGIFNKVQYRFVKNEPRRSREILKELGLKPVENEDLLPHDEAAKESILKKINRDGRDNRPIIVINPGAKFESKCWPPEYFAETAKWIYQEYHSNVIVTGTAPEKEIAERIVRSSGDFVTNLAGRTTIQELIELLRISRSCVTNDTGTMHIAAMVKTRTVGIFSARYSPSHWLPKGSNIISIFSLPECRDCYKEQCDTVECLKSVRVENVVKALDKMFIDKDESYNG